MNSKEKGDIAIAHGIAYYMGLQHEVLLPIGDKKPYDFIVDDGELKKVQCKYTSHKTKYGIYKAPLRVMGGNQSYHTAKSYKKGDFDIFFVHTESNDTYAIPYKAIEGNVNSVALGKKMQKYKI